MVIDIHCKEKIPLISVIVINWNGNPFLNNCLYSLKDQNFKDFEIIVIDNGSTDKSVDEFEKNWPNIKIERLKENIGFAAANNLGATLAKGSWIALLNNDAFPKSGWLQALIEAAITNPEFSFFASCLVMAEKNDYVDGMGDTYHFSGMAWRRGHGKPLDIVSQKAIEVFGPCAAAAFYPRDLFLKNGGFDEDFFCYHEDVDLAFRLRLQGHRCLYIPEAVVRHVGSGSHGEHSDIVRYYSHRNMVWTFFKNMPSPLIWWYLPLHILFNLFSVMYFLWKGQGQIIWKAKRDAIYGFKRVIYKRRKIQQTRRVKYPEIKKVMDKHLFNPYVKPTYRTE